MKIRFALLFLLLCVCSFCAAKVITKTTKTPRHGAYLPIGRAVTLSDKIGVVTIRARFVKAYTKSKVMHYSSGEQLPEATMNISYVEDVLWDRYAAEDSCVDRLNINHNYKKLMVPLNGSWSEDCSMNVVAPRRTRVWYVVAEDCQLRVLHQHNRDLPKLEIEATIMNDNSHF